MVVEDDPGTASYFKRVLERGDMDVTVAGSAVAATKQMDAGEWDALLVDIGLPDRSGFDLVLEVKDRWPLLPIALTTANANTNVAIRALRSKVDDLLPKPIDPRELLHHLEQLLELGRARAAGESVATNPERQAELERAQQIQQGLLPHSAPEVPGYDVAGGCIPVSEVGGDFYDWFAVGTSLQLTIADVMGKGLGAAIIAASVRAVLRSCQTGRRTVGDEVTAAALTLQPDLDDTATFVTLFTARLEPATSTLTFVDAGHGLALAVARSGTTRQLRGRDLPLGVGAERWTERSIELTPGETVICVSDGLLDYFDSRASIFAAAGRVAREAATAQDVVDEIAALARSRPADDDLTAVVVRKLDS